MRTRIKICGITRAEDLDAAIDAGVDALGFVFYSKSPRYIKPLEVKKLLRRAPAWITSVGLFVNSNIEEVNRAAGESQVSHIQLHGDESPQECESLDRPVVKAIRLALVNDFSSRSSYEEAIEVKSKEVEFFSSVCSAVLFDVDSPGFGGSGISFDWGILNNILNLTDKRWVLSGGLSIDNIKLAIRKFNPPCVDISSGVEEVIKGKLQKGKKDRVKIFNFVKSVELANKVE